MTPRGIRNANPTNLRDSAESWQGQTGADDAGFCVFSSPEFGIRAAVKVLLAYRQRHGLRTIREYIGRWAPPSENNTPAYVAAVCATCNVGPDDDYPLTAESLPPLVAAIIWHENGQQPYPPETIAAGIAAALGLQPTAAPVAKTLQPVAIDEITKQEAPVLPAIIPALLPSIVSAIPALAQIFGSGSEVSTRNLKAAQVVADTVVAATNSVNLQEAAEKLKADDNARQAAQIAVLAQPAIAALLEVGGGIVEARKANLAMQGERSPLYNPALWMTLLFMTLPGMLMVDVFYVHPAQYSGELRTQIVTAVLTVVSIVGAYWFGTTRGSERKTELSAQQSRII